MKDREEEQVQEDQIVAGRNPVIELLRSDRPVDKIYMQKAEHASGSLGKIMAMAREKRIPVKECAKERLDLLCPGLNHQGVAAVCAAFRYAELSEVYSRAREAGEPLFLVVADGIEDPHNLGAIIRTADAVGAHAVIIPRRHGAGLTASVMRASAGAAEHLPVVRVTNITETIKQLKKDGVWVYGADMDGASWCQTDFSGPAALVVGSEGKGISRLVREHCDAVVSLPMKGKINSLNASVAAGVILYEIARQRLHIAARQCEGRKE